MMYPMKRRSQVDVTMLLSQTEGTTKFLFLMMQLLYQIAPSQAQSNQGESVQPIKCVQCTNFRNGQSYDFCPVNSFVDLSKAYADDCEGACFTRLQPDNHDVVSRGCTSYMSLPHPLPPEDGCYTWEGTTFCVCRTAYCNIRPIGKASDVRLDDHLQDEYNATATGDLNGPLQCYDCASHDADNTFYPQCPKNDRVNPTKVGRGNCTGVCFTRSDPGNPDKVYRGCTDTQYGLPVPLPPDGCYNWNDAVFCTCSKPSCNGRAIEPSNGKDLDYHLDAIEDANSAPLDPDGKRRCYQCLNYDDKGNYYKQCPKHKRVRNAYLDVCNGTCFTRSYDYDDKRIARGCTDSQRNLPDPLPPDGCYTWYSEVWCVCSNSRCNGKAIGEPQAIEFDAHIKEKDGGTAVSLKPGLAFVSAVACLAAVWLSVVFGK